MTTTTRTRSVLLWMAQIRLAGLFLRELTAFAAAGLVIIMTGAAAVSIPLGVIATLTPAVVGVLCAWIARRRGVETIGGLPRLSMAFRSRAHA